MTTAYSSLQEWADCAPAQLQKEKVDASGDVACMIMISDFGYALKLSGICFLLCFGEHTLEI